MEDNLNQILATCDQLQRDLLELRAAAAESLEAMAPIRITEEDRILLRSIHPGFLNPSLVETEQIPKPKRGVKDTEAMVMAKYERYSRGLHEEVLKRVPILLSRMGAVAALANRVSGVVTGLIEGEDQ